VTFFHSIQLVLLAVVVGLVVARVRALSFRGGIDAAAMRRALVALLREGRVDEARRLAVAARPAIAVEPALALLEPELPDDERVGVVDERLLDLTAEAWKGLVPLRALASVASALGFIGGAIEIHWVFAGDHGLLRLSAGLVESIGLSRAFLSIALGIATSSFAFGSLVVLRKRARDLVADGRRLLAGVEEAMEARA
jgi:hypothetical protein